ncbi:unnamed protein product [Amoebophrya sp. A120]|nr:unnamed protein product [Amoebophrya sp. A120]|eukprot:GSA120T00012565001.1
MLRSASSSSRLRCRSGHQKKMQHFHAFHPDPASSSTFTTFRLVQLLPLQPAAHGSPFLPLVQHHLHRLHQTNSFTTAASVTFNRGAVFKPTAVIDPRRKKKFFRIFVPLAALSATVLTWELYLRNNYLQDCEQRRKKFEKEMRTANIGVSYYGQLFGFTVDRTIEEKLESGDLLFYKRRVAALPFHEVVTEVLSSLRERVTTRSRVLLWEGKNAAAGESYPATVPIKASAASSSPSFLPDLLTTTQTKVAVVRQDAAATANTKIKVDTYPEPTVAGVFYNEWLADPERADVILRKLEPIVMTAATTQINADHDTTPAASSQITIGTPPAVVQELEEDEPIVPVVENCKTVTVADFRNLVNTGQQQQHDSLLDLTAATVEEVKGGGVLLRNVTWQGDAPLVSSTAPKQKPIENILIIDCNLGAEVIVR